MVVEVFWREGDVEESEKQFVSQSEKWLKKKRVAVEQTTDIDRRYAERKQCNC